MAPLTAAMPSSLVSSYLCHIFFEGLLFLCLPHSVLVSPRALSLLPLLIFIPSSSPVITTTTQVSIALQYKLQIRLSFHWLLSLMLLRQFLLFVFKFPFSQLYFLLTLLVLQLKYWESILLLYPTHLIPSVQQVIKYWERTTVPPPMSASPSSKAIASTQPSGMSAWVFLAPTTLSLLFTNGSDHLSVCQTPTWISRLRWKVNPLKIFLSSFQYKTKHSFLFLYHTLFFRPPTIILYLYIFLP